MIDDRTMEALTADMTAENLKAVFTELSSYKQKSSNLEKKLALAEARLSIHENEITDKDNSYLALDPDHKAKVYLDWRIVRDRQNLYSARNLDGSTPVHELQGRFTHETLVIEALDDYVIKQAVAKTNE